MGTNKREKNTMQKMNTLRINGVDQRYCILGNNPNNPVIMYLHGGPGDTCLPLIEKFNSALSRHFNLVVWDQRGAGFSYYPFDEGNHPTVDTFIDDLQILTQHILDAYRQEKVYLIGHSWGSILGIRFIQEHPELVHRYIGCGQVVNFNEVTKEQLEFVRARTSDKRTLDFLDNYPKASEGPDWVDALLKLTKLVVKYGGSLYGQSNMDNLVWPFIMSRRYNIRQLMNRVKGSTQSIAFLWPEVAATDYSAIHHFDVPVSFFEGRHDSHVSSRLAHRWYEQINSPKSWHWFERSGHFPQWEEPELFMDYLLETLNEEN